ncbi:MAG: response regulator [Chloroflexi bacterium]|nr:MAG: response regulator [Chloroflexota bacterium]
MTQNLALIVEDDPDLIEIFSRILKMLKFSVEKISSGSEAVAYLAHAEPALILLDLNLPEVSGRDILYKIRLDERLKHIKVLLVTADIVNVRPLSQMADGILIKPIGVQELRQTINELFPTNQDSA